MAAWDWKWIVGSIAIPIILAVVGFIIDRSNKKRKAQAAEKTKLGSKQPIESPTQTVGNDSNRNTQSATEDSNSVQQIDDNSSDNTQIITSSGKSKQTIGTRSNGNKQSMI